MHKIRRKVNTQRVAYWACRTKPTTKIRKEK